MYCNRMKEVERGSFERVRAIIFSPLESLKSLYIRRQISQADKLSQALYNFASENPSGGITANAGDGGFEVSFWHARQHEGSDEKVSVQNCRLDMGGMTVFQGISAKAISYDASGEIIRTFSSFTNGINDLPLDELLGCLGEAKTQTKVGTSD